METTYDVPMTSSRGSTVADVERWGSLVGAAVLVAYGLSRRSLPGAWLVAAAAPLAYRGLAGQWPQLPSRVEAWGAPQTRRALAGSRGIQVRESVRLERPLAEVYRFWRTLENLPRFMTHLERVTDLGEGRSHWVATGPADVRVEWAAEIINDVENQVIAWKSLPGAEVVSAGSVNFDAVRDGRSTQVSVNLQYAPPAGRVGGWVATLAGREPSQMIREDLRRMKQLLEVGEIARATHGSGGVR
jgi:uncharacterized membrane protein